MAKTAEFLLLRDKLRRYLFTGGAALHREPLSEPDVNVSVHTAPTTELPFTIRRRMPLAATSPCRPVSLWASTPLPVLMNPPTAAFGPVILNAPTLVSIVQP